MHSTEYRSSSSFSQEPLLSERAAVRPLPKPVSPAARSFFQTKPDHHRRAGDEMLEDLLSTWKRVKEQKTSFLLVDWQPSSGNPPSALFLHRRVVKLTPLMWTLPTFVRGNPDKLHGLQEAFTRLREETKVVAALEKLIAEQADDTATRYRKLADIAQAAVAIGLVNHPAVQSILNAPWYLGIINSKLTNLRSNVVEDYQSLPEGSVVKKNLNASESPRQFLPDSPVGLGEATTTTSPPANNSPNPSRRRSAARCSVQETGVYDGFTLVGYITSDGYFEGDTPGVERQDDYEQPNRWPKSRFCPGAGVLCCAEPVTPRGHSMSDDDTPVSHKPRKKSPLLRLANSSELRCMPVILTQLGPTAGTLGTPSTAGPTDVLLSGRRATTNMIPNLLISSPKDKVVTHRRASTNDILLNSARSSLQNSHGPNKYYNRPDALQKYARRLSVQATSEDEQSSAIGSKRGSIKQLPPEILNSLAKHIKASQKINEIIRNEKQKAVENRRASRRASQIEPVSTFSPTKLFARMFTGSSKRVTSAASSSTSSSSSPSRDDDDDGGEGHHDSPRQSIVPPLREAIPGYNGTTGGGFGFFVDKARWSPPSCCTTDSGRLQRVSSESPSAKLPKLSSVRTRSCGVVGTSH